MIAAALEQLKQEMEHALESLRVEFAKVRTGRVSTSLIEGVLVDYYGARTPLNHRTGSGESRSLARVEQAEHHRGWWPKAIHRRGTSHRRWSQSTKRCDQTLEGLVSLLAAPQGRLWCEG